VSSPCFEFGVALRTGHDLRKSVKRPARKARPLLVRRTTLFEIDRSNDLFSDQDAKLLFRPDGRPPGFLALPLAEHFGTSFSLLR
jgi:hypothetical protein